MASERRTTSSATNRAAAQAFLRRLRGRYEVDQAILFGSRARGDHRSDSDLDLAILLRGERRSFIDTKLDMAGIAFDALLETGVLVQALPLWEDDLQHPEHFANPALIRAITADGIWIDRPRRSRRTTRGRHDDGRSFQSSAETAAAAVLHGQGRGRQDVARMRLGDRAGG